MSAGWYFTGRSINHIGKIDALVRESEMICVQDDNVVTSQWPLGLPRASATLVAAVTSGTNKIQFYFIFKILLKFKVFTNV